MSVGKVTEASVCGGGDTSELNGVIGSVGGEWTGVGG